MPRKNKGHIGIELQDEKPLLAELAQECGAVSMADFLRRMLRQLKNEKTRLGIARFSETDITFRSK